MDSFLNISNSDKCACGGLRKTTRAITQYYDRCLLPTGLRSTQYSLLYHISLSDNPSISELGESLLMDQTTVTRNIAILRKQGYVALRRDENDARKKSVTLTEKGRQKLLEAVPVWKLTQDKIEQGLGEQRYQQLLGLLREIEHIVE